VPHGVAAAAVPRHHPRKPSGQTYASLR
jgi:hypothetical protein